MPGFLRVLTGRWALTAFGFASAAAMVWLFGSLQSGLEGWLPRTMVIAAIALVWVAINMVMDLLRRRLDRRLSEGVVAGGTSGGHPAKPAGVEEATEQRERLSRAMALLRAARGTRGYLYEQPWYAIIGPPGAGKTTALANAGLRFPLAAELGSGEIKGVGGTRFCDWSFTDEAVLIDTAGRYTTQDSEEAVDKAGWDAFLALLRRVRPRQPLNGVIVAISITEVVGSAEPVRRSHASAIRARLKELYSGLGCRLPIYVVFTKLDLIQGFTDFFDDLTAESRAQVWGTTFPLEQGHAGPAGSFPVEFHALSAQLSARMLNRLQAERSPERRTAIADFPFQFASLEAPLVSFLDDAFMGTRLEPAVLLRGVYFASGTQEGTPIDRLTGVLARSFGLDQRRNVVVRPLQGRGYFLEKLLKSVVFAEAMLVVRDTRIAWRRRIIRAGAWSTTALMLVLGLCLVGLGTLSATNRQQRFDAALEEYGQIARTTQLSPVEINGGDLPKVISLVDKAAALQDVSRWPTGLESWLGLAQDASQGQGAAVLYRRTLDHILLPRLVSQAEAGMRAAGNDLDRLYQATRVYLILCGKGSVDRAMVRSWMNATWSLDYAGESLGPFRANLLRHLDALLAEPISEFVPVDAALLARSQAKLANIGIADRAYTLLRASEAAGTTRPFVPAEAIGALAGNHFRRRSTRSLQEPVPGLFTAAGFQTVVLPGMPHVTERAIRESWVLGRSSEVDLNDTAARQLIEAGVMKLYAAEYQAVWDGLLDDLDVVAPVDANAAVTDFALLTSPQGPMKLLLAAVAKELTLYSAPEPSTPPKPVSSTDPSIQALELHFRDLRGFVQRGQMDTVFAAMDRLQQQIAAQVASNASGVAPALSPGIDQAQALKRTADSAPPPVSRWLQALAQRGGAVRDEASRQQASAAYSGQGGALPLCQQVVQRFPFRAAAREDVTMASFVDLFAPNGRFDRYFTQFVRPFVDTSSPAWRIRDPGNAQAPVAADGVAQFQRALAIRDVFFSFGNTPQVRFAVRPGFTDASSGGFTLDLGGITASWKTSDQRSTQTFEWPGATHMTAVSAVFDPPPPVGPELRQNGEWALLRLFRDARPDRTAGRDTDSLVLRQGDRQVQLFLTAASARSPFNGELLSQFRCPILRGP